jgi:hypothetical protein
MSDFKSALKAFDLEKALAADRGKDCLIIDVGRNENGQSLSSHVHAIEQVDQHLQQARAFAFAATRLYIIGEWNLTPHEHEDGANEKVKETKVSA